MIISGEKQAERGGEDIASGVCLSLQHFGFGSLSDFSGNKYKCYKYSNDVRREQRNSNVDLHIILKNELG